MCIPASPTAERPHAMGIHGIGPGMGWREKGGEKIHPWRVQGTLGVVYGSSLATLWPDSQVLRHSRGPWHAWALAHPPPSTSAGFSAAPPKVSLPMRYRNGQGFTPALWVTM